jgi:hypothetical protein
LVITDALLRSPETAFSAIPLKTGIQSFQAITWILDTRIRGYDDFLRDDNIYHLKFTVPGEIV